MNKTPRLESQVLEITAGWLSGWNSSPSWPSEAGEKISFLSMALAFSGGNLG